MILKRLQYIPEQQSNLLEASSKGQISLTLYHLVFPLKYQFEQIHLLL